MVFVFRFVPGTASQFHNEFQGYVFFGVGYGGVEYGYDFLFDDGWGSGLLLTNGLVRR